jgi:SAM-dependent methyltransferase
VAIDASAHAVEATRRETSILAPEPVAAGMLEVRQADLLDLPAELSARRFDLVYSFGVLHHTGDTYRAMRELAGLVGHGGMFFLYLYGRATVTAARRVALSTARALLSVLPLRAKRQVLARLLPGRDLHQAFDLLSPLVNDRFDHATVERWLRELGFTDVTTTLDHTEIFMRASRGDGAAASLLPLPLRPYWFERYRRPPPTGDGGRQRR